MEIEQQAAGFEIEDQVKVMIQTVARSHECNFCKRGFTNAQALGGHMNIHRKEKAKLKQSSSPPLLSSNKMPMDIPKILTPARLPWVNPSAAAEGHGQGGGGENTTLTIEEILVCEGQQLPLFIEKPSNMDQKLEIHQVLPSEVVATDHKAVPSFRHGPIISELDLELRLGPEPQINLTSSSAPAGSTRHFF